MPGYFMGIDVGTTASKAILCSADGSVLATASSEYPMQTPQIGWAEQDPHDWWTATCQSIRSIRDQVDFAPGELGGIGLTGQMHGLVMLDRSGEVLRPCIMWNDQRSAPQCEQLEQRIGLQELLDRTGNRLLPGFTAPKIAWVAQNEPGILSRTGMILLPKDYVRYRLTGGYFSDVADASGTSLLDCRNRRWSSDMLEAIGVDESMLPHVTESPEPSSAISREGALATGLAEGTPVIAGAGDQAAQAVGCGIVQEGVISVTIGTSGVVFASSDQWKTPQGGVLHSYCHAVPGQWHLMGVMLSAAGSLKWYRDTLAESTRLQESQTGQDAYDILTDEAATVPPGADGVFFLPYLSGERTPWPDPDARGTFIGLARHHQRAHVTRSVLEGITFGLADCLELVRSAGIEARKIRISGGGASSGFWRQLCADVFKCRVATVNTTEGAAFGAAILASVGAGCHESVQGAVKVMIREEEEHDPGPQAAMYETLLERYDQLYPALKDLFRTMARQQQDAEDSPQG